MLIDPHRLYLVVIPYSLAVCRLDRKAPIPDWATLSRFWSITRSEDELSIVCEEALVPAGVRSESGWRGLKLAGPLDFNLTGILASLLEPLAQVGVSIFAISTFDTDYLLVKQSQLDQAVAALQSAGHKVDDV